MDRKRGETFNYTLYLLDKKIIKVKTNFYKIKILKSNIP